VWTNLSIFFRFPANKILKKKWCAVLNVKEDELKKTLAVCSRHFSADTFGPQTRLRMKLDQIDDNLVMKSQLRVAFCRSPQRSLQRAQLYVFIKSVTLIQLLQQPVRLNQFAFTKWRCTCHLLSHSAQYHFLYHCRSRLLMLSRCKPGVCIFRRIL
jgi:THAP domain